MTKGNGFDTKIAVMQTDIKYIKETVDELNTKLESKYVTQDEFDPIKKLTYGLVALILTSVVGTVISIVVNSPK
jgi:ABC-type phosphate transport system permease subunit